MKIGNKLIIGFTLIASLVGFVGIFSAISHNNIQTNSEIITKVLELNILLNKSVVKLLALIQTENIEDYVREKLGYEQIRAKVDTLFKQLNNEYAKKLPDLGFNVEAFHKDAGELAKISNRLIALHKRSLAKNKVTKEKESLEKELRHKILSALVALQDNALTRDAELMQYKSKEALYQYKDKEHGVEWLESLKKVKDNSLIEPLQETLKDLNAYERVAQDMCKIIVEQKTIETQEHLVFRELKELIDRLGENRARIVNKIKAESQALARNTHLIMFAVIIGAFLVSIILGLTIARSISKPVANLAQTTQAIAQGDFSLRLNITTNDEIGELAASFNAMAGKLKESYIDLEEKVQERTAKLEDEVEQRTSTQETLEERIKEINCLYSLSKLVEQPGIPLGAIFQGTTELIRMAYQYPDFTCVRITFNGVKYITDNFDKSELSQHAQIKVGREKAGEIEVYYLGDNAESDEGPFFQEESELLDAVGEHLGRIAERRKTREKLELFRNLIDRSNDCIFVMELKWGRFLDVNDKACASLGYTQEELLTMSFKDIEESIRDESAWQRQTEKLKVKSDLVIQGRHRCKDATTFYAETSLKYVSQGKEDYVIAVARDVTERKKVEEEREKLLEQVESINKELKDFAYIVSHDLKAPLRGIKTLADWISTDYADKLDEEGREQIGLLSGRVVRMHNLIDGVLQYSRVGREKVKQVRVNLNELVSEVIDLVAPPENIEIRVENELPIIECEETRTMQVFQNLLSNAVKYMDKPRGRIRIGCVQEDGFWKFSVSDNGPGIEKQHYEKIFQIFQTLSPRDEVESTGVGLSVVKKIVELYGGKIWVESKPGEGSTFFFMLPKPESEVEYDAKLEADIVS